MIELKHNFLYWFKRHHFIYLFGVLINFQPIRPFLNDMLLTDKNITYEQYQRDIYPVCSYSAVVVSLLLLITIPFCLVNYIFILYSIGGLVTAAAVWGGSTAAEIEFAEGFSGCVVAAEIFYLASLYVGCTSRKNLSSLTCLARAYPLVAQLVAAVFAQICISKELLNYQALAFLGFPAAIYTCMLLQHFPALLDQEETPETLRTKYRFFRSTLKDLYAIEHVVQWCFWIACSSASFVQLTTKVQSFWVLRGQDPSNNGGVEGIFALFSLLGVGLSSSLKMDWNNDIYLLLIASSLEAVLLIAMTAALKTWISNLCYVFVGFVHSFVTTSLLAEVASKVYHNVSFCVTFGLIGFITAVVNLIFVLIVDQHLIGWDIQDKFYINGMFNVGLGILVLMAWLCRKLI